jgi:hypothetical protein
MLDLVNSLFSIAWPWLVALLILGAVRRQPPGGPLMRIMGGILAALVVAPAFVPHDTVTGHAIAPNEDMITLVVLGMGICFACTMIGRSHL